MQFPQFDVDDLVDILLRQGVEIDLFVQAVEEFRGKYLAERLVDQGVLRSRPVFGPRGETDAATEILQFPAADVRRQDQDRVLEIDVASRTVRQAAFVQDLQQQVEDVGMGLFHLVEQHDRIRLAADLLAELAALIVTHIARRRPDEAAGGEFLSVFAHIDPDDAVGRIKHILCYLLGQMCLAHTGRPQEEEGSDGLVRVLEPGPVPPDRLDDLRHRFVLPDDHTPQHFFHLHQPRPLILGDLVNRNVGHHRNHAGHGILIHGLVGLLVRRSRLHGCRHRLFFLFFKLPKLGRPLEVARLDGAALFGPDGFQVALQPDGFVRSLHVADVDPCTGLVQHVDGLVRQATV